MPGGLAEGDGSAEERAEDAVFEEQALLLSHAERLASIGSWDHDLVKNRLRWSAQVYHIFGLDPATFELSFDAFFQLVHPDDRQVILEGRQKALKRDGLLENEYRIRHADGSERVLQQRGEVLYDKEGTAIRRRGMVLDVTERKQAEGLAAAQREILEMIIDDAELNAVLEVIVHLVECRLPGALVSILLLDREQRLRMGVAPSLPEAYSAAVDGIKIGPEVGSCGTAAFTRQPVFVSDIANDRLWRGSAEVAAEAALAHGLRACWSMPVFAREQVVLGTFAIYRRHCHSPAAEEIALVEAITHLAGLAISHQRAEEALRSSDLQFASAFAHASIGMALVSPEGRWLKVNRALCQMLGYSEEELERTTFQDITHPDDLMADMDLVGQVLAGQIDTFHMEKRYFHKQGQIVSCLLSVSLVRDSEGLPLHFISQVQDVTLRKKAEERIAEQAALLDKAQDAILVRNLDHVVLFWNKGAERLYGWTAEEVAGSNVGNFLCHDAAKLEDARKVTLERGEWSGELFQVTKAGREVIVESRWSLLLDSAGRPKSILSINTDITERKQLEAQFLRAQRMESIGTLAGGIAHDLNNVLAPIMMSIDLLKLRISDPVGLDTLALISSSARRGAEMVSQVLCFARGIEGERIAFDSLALMRDLEKFVKETFPKNMVFELVEEADLPPVVGDATQVYQVILNLCVNARDAMPDGGRLSVTVGHRSVTEQLAVQGLNVRPGSFVVFEIQDTGMGIPPEIIDKIFDPFFTTKEVGRGTGLGLSTSAAIVRSHGGFLEVSTQPGTGTCFKVYLPAAGSATAGAQPGVPSVLLPPGKGELILVVDDEMSIRRVTSQTLETFGYRVLLAAHGAEALEFYEAHRSDIAVVLTDMMMPVMDGLELIRALQKQDALLPVIAASGVGAAGQVAKAWEAGVRHFIAKPYTAEVLLNTLAVVLPPRE